MLFELTKDYNNFLSHIQQPLWNRQIKTSVGRNHNCSTRLSRQHRIHLTKYLSKISQFPLSTQPPPPKATATTTVATTSTTTANERAVTTTSSLNNTINKITIHDNIPCLIGIGHQTLHGPVYLLLILPNSGPNPLAHNPILPSFLRKALAFLAQVLLQGHNILLMASNPQMLNLLFKLALSIHQTHLGTWTPGTSTYGNLSSFSPLSTNNHIIVGNGKNVPISGIGNANLTPLHPPLLHKNVLHASKLITKISFLLENFSLIIMTP